MFHDTAPIDAQACFEESRLPDSLRGMAESSVAVGNLYQTFKISDLVSAIMESGLNVAAIAVAHEIRGQFTRACDYATPEGMDLSANPDNVDPDSPGFFGFIQHPNDTITVVLFVRTAIDDLVSQDTKEDNRRLYKIIELYRAIVTALSKQGHNENIVFQMVGIFSGLIAKRLKKDPNNSDIVTMCHQSNMNTVRCVISAIQQKKAELGIPNEHIVIVGSNGYVGKSVMGDQELDGAQGIDNAISGQTIETFIGSLPHNAQGNFLVVDITNGGLFPDNDKTIQLISRLQQLLVDRPGVRLHYLGEVFPPVTPKIVGLLKDLEVFQTVNHIAGVRVKEFVPHFPGPYAGLASPGGSHTSVAPCCMSQEDHSDPDVAVISL